MWRLIRVEWRRVWSNRPFLVLLFVLIVLSFVHLEIQFPNRSLPYPLSELVGPAYDAVTAGRHSFWRIMCDASTVSWFSIPFAAILIGRDFSHRCVSAEIMAGHSRGQILLVKASEYYILFFLILTIYPAAAICRRCIPWLQNLDSADTAYLLQGVLLKTVLDLGLISVCLFFAFLCRGMLKTLAVTMAYTLLMPVLSGINKKVAYFLPVSHYSYLIRQPNPIPGSMWDVPPMDLPEFLVIVVGSLLITLLSLLGSYLLFRRADLR